VSAFKSQQRLLNIRGRAFHFVSYEGQPANVKRGEEASPAMWYLMVEGRRCAALVWEQSQSLDDVDRDLTRWAAENAFGSSEAPAPTAGSIRSGPIEQARHWWGPS
jgi:hypothetical protein